MEIFQSKKFIGNFLKAAFHKKIVFRSLQENYTTQIGGSAEM